MTPSRPQPEPEPRLPDPDARDAVAARPEPPNVGTPPATDHATARLAELATLRELLLGQETRRIQQLEGQINDPLRYTQDIIRVLPEAVAVRTKQDDKLARALAPTIDTAIKESVRRDPGSLVAAIAPVMGPAIRKSINDALQGLIQSFNTTLEDSFNWRWRLEAWRTGKRYAEIVMLHKLEYRVEQVFLIHRDGGLLLHHVVAHAGNVQDADMVSGMLTAIRDFAKDSFGVKDGGSMDSLRIGDLTVWIESGTKSVLAIVFRGNAPQALRLRLQDVFMQVQIDLGPELGEFTGDTAPFARAAEPMRSLLLKAERPEQSHKRAFPYFAIAAVVIVGLLTWWGIVSWRADARWDRFLATLKQEPGIVLTGVTENGSKRVVGVLRDAFAKDPDVILEEAGVDRANVEIKRELYQSLHPEFILRRAEKVLGPPTGTTLSVSEGLLKAKGRAGHVWVVRARREAPRVFGVSGYDDRELEDTDATKLVAIKEAIETISLRFVFAQTELAGGQEETLNQLTVRLFELHQAADAAQIEYQVQIVGHTDSSGTEERNTRLSRDRADRLTAILALRGVPTEGLAGVGVGYGQPETPGQNDRDNQRNRRVTFKVLYLEQPEWVKLRPRSP